MSKISVYFIVIIILKNNATFDARFEKDKHRVRLNTIRRSEEALPPNPPYSLCPTTPNV